MAQFNNHDENTIFENTNLETTELNDTTRQAPPVHAAHMQKESAKQDDKKFTAKHMAVAAAGGLLIGSVIPMVAQTGSSSESEIDEEAKPFDEADKNIAASNEEEAVVAQSLAENEAEKSAADIALTSTQTTTTEESSSIHMGNNSIINNGTINIYTTGNVPQQEVEEVTEEVEDEPARNFNFDNVVDGELPIAFDVNNDMSFGQAFAAARAEVGSGGVFEWRGDLYSTYTAEEWRNLTPVERTDYNSHFAWNNIDHTESDTIAPDDQMLAQHTHYRVTTTTTTTTTTTVEEIEIEGVYAGGEDILYAADIDATDEVPVEGVDIEVESVGVNPETGMDYAHIRVNGQDAVMIDVDGVPGYDVLATRDEYGDLQFTDISDANIQPEDVMDMAGLNGADDYFASDNSDFDFNDNNGLYEI